jgi:hypothetical protein
MLAKGIKGKVSFPTVFAAVVLFANVVGGFL